MEKIIYMYVKRSAIYVINILKKEDGESIIKYTVCFPMVSLYRIPLQEFLRFQFPKNKPISQGKAGVIVLLYRLNILICESNNPETRHFSCCRLLP